MTANVATNIVDMDLSPPLLGLTGWHAKLVQGKNCDIWYRFWYSLAKEHNTTQYNIESLHTVSV